MIFCRKKERKLTDQEIIDNFLTGESFSASDYEVNQAFARRLVDLENKLDNKLIDND